MREKEKKKKGRGKIIFFGSQTHSCLQFGCQICELTAVRVLQLLVVLLADQLHMPAEDDC